MTWTDLDDMVEGDPLALRDKAWGEILALQVQLKHLREGVAMALGCATQLSDDELIKLADRYREDVENMAEEYEQF